MECVKKGSKRFVDLERCRLVEVSAVVGAGVFRVGILAIGIVGGWCCALPLNATLNGCMSDGLFFDILFSVLRELECDLTLNKVAASASSSVKLLWLLLFRGVEMP